MGKRMMKVGEIFTAERVVNGGTNCYFAPVRLVNVALVGMDKTPLENMPGAPEVQSFVFCCLQEGDAEIQLARLCGNLSETCYEEVLPISVEAVGGQDAIVGGWSPFEKPKEEDLKVFEKVQSALKGVDYTPIKVSKQIVNGTNYRFACAGKTVTAKPETFPAIVKAHVSLDGEVTDVKAESVLL